MLRFIRRLNPKRFQLYKREILLRNAKALNTYLGVGIAVAMINVLLQADIHKTTTFIEYRPDGVPYCSIFDSALSD